MTLRILKIQKSLHRILMDYFLTKNPYPGVISVKEIKVQSDLKRANIYISVMGRLEDAERTRKKLEEDRFAIRSLINSRLRMKYSPYLQFFVNHVSMPLSPVEKTLMELREKDEIS